MKPFSLYDLAGVSRKALIGFLILATLVIAADTAAKWLTGTGSPFVPTVTQWQDIPSNAFGKLSLPAIKSLAIGSDSPPTFGIRGDFPLFPDTAQVYQITKPKEKLDAPEKAKAVAQKAGFNGQVFNNVNNLMRWVNERQTRSLEYHTINNTWNLRTVSYFQDANAIKPKTTDKATDYGAAASSMLSQLNLSNATFNGGKSTFELVKRRAERFVPVTFSETPDYAIASVYRTLLMSLPKPGTNLKDKAGQQVKDFNAYVYSVDPFVGSVHAVLADRGRDPSIDLYEFKFTDYDYTKITSYYNIITPTVAWQNVQTGKGALVSLIPQSRHRFQDYETVSVKSFTSQGENTELAYLEPSEWTGFVYPMYIFRGVAELTNGETANFIFYVDAIRP
jgi:hypothetical protein